MALATFKKLTPRVLAIGVLGVSIVATLTGKGSQLSPGPAPGGSGGEGVVLTISEGTGKLFCACLAAAAVPGLTAQSTREDDRLPRLLKRYPEADTDKDGMLKPEEARAFFRELRSRNNAGVAGFDMASYLEHLSAKGRGGGYKEFVYKQTPQGELRIYFALPAGWSPSDRRPAVVFFYGGGWSGGNVFSYNEQSEYFARCGVVAGMADYRVRKRHGVTPDKCVEDARSAVRWIRANSDKLGVDPHRVIAGGGSAGGHIAACSAIPIGPNSASDNLDVSCIPDGLMLCFPPTGLRGESGSSLFEVMLGKDLADKLLPTRHVTASWPPTIMFFGTADRLLLGGVSLYEKAKEAGVMCELYLAEGQGHGFVNISPWNYVSSRYAADFFTRAGVMKDVPLPEVPPGELRKYAGEPVETLLIRMNVNPTRQLLEGRGREAKKEGPHPPEGSAGARP